MSLDTPVFYIAGIPMGLCSFFMLYTVLRTRMWYHDEHRFPGALVHGISRTIPLSAPLQVGMAVVAVPFILTIATIGFSLYSSISPLGLIGAVVLGIIVGVFIALAIIWVMVWYKLTRIVSSHLRMHAHVQAEREEAHA